MRTRWEYWIYPEIMIFGPAVPETGEEIQRHILTYDKRYNVIDTLYELVSGHKIRYIIMSPEDYEQFSAEISYTRQSTGPVFLDTFYNIPIVLVSNSDPDAVKLASEEFFSYKIKMFKEKENDNS